MIAPVLDACCGSRMFWFDKESPLAIFQDCRRGVQTLCDGRVLVVEPDVLADARNMPYPDNWFAHVVLDPPHLVNVGEHSFTFAKYGRLPPPEISRATFARYLPNASAFCARREHSVSSGAPSKSNLAKFCRSLSRTSPFTGRKKAKAHSGFNSSKSNLVLQKSRFMQHKTICHPDTPESGQQATDAAPWWGYHVEEVLERESWDDVHPYWAVCENCSRCIVAKYSIDLHPNAERAAHRECKRLNKRQLRERKRHRK